MMYVLIVISMANGGQTLTTQEFTSMENCMIASNAIKDNSRYKTFTIYSSCVAK